MGCSRLTVLSLAILCIASAANVKADSATDFVKVTCLPEVDLFEIEQVTLNDLAVGGESRLESWRKNGFVSPRKLSAKCALKSVTVQYDVDQEAGSARQCGAHPEITASLKIDSTVWFENIWFGNSCRGYPTVTKVSLSPEGGIAEVCFAPRGEDHQYCQVVLGNPGAPEGDLIPVTRSKLDNYAREIGTNYPRFR